MHISFGLCPQSPPSPLLYYSRGYRMKVKHMGCCMVLSFFFLGQCDVGVTSADSEFLCDESGGISAYISNSVWYYFLFPLFAHL